MTTVPGSAGLPVLGDKSYEFYKDPVKFQLKHMASTKSRVFLSRFLNKSTIFVGSNEVLKQLLEDDSGKLEMGYKAFMGEIYGNNILFSDGDSAESLRQVLRHLFTPECVTSYQDTINRVVKQAFTQMDTSQPICIYTFFKKLAIEICLTLFLGVDFSQADDTAQTITKLTTTHWHGMISVPVNFKLPMLSDSGYKKAMEAKKILLEVIADRRAKKQYSFPQKVQSLPDIDEVAINNHLLLFTSALVPKALSSILTSFTTELGKPERVSLQEMVRGDNDIMDSVLLEVLRLYPPFLGGRRLVRQDLTIGGYKFPTGSAIIYLTYAAHRDPNVFESPNDFKPGRWQSRNKDDKDKLYSFGAGPRECLGQSLVWSIINTVLTEMLTNFTFSVLDGQDLDHKWLPVSRPKSEILVQFQHRTTESQS